ALREIAGWRLEPDSDVPLVSMLTRAFPELRKSLRKLALLRPVTPLVAVDLRASDWIQLRVFSLPVGVEGAPGDPPPAGIEEYVPGRGWTPAGAHEAPPQ